jgi:hypothetical protein
MSGRGELARILRIVRFPENRVFHKIAADFGTNLEVLVGLPVAPRGRLTVVRSEAGPCAADVIEPLAAQNHSCQTGLSRP